MDLKKLQQKVNGWWASQTDNPCHGSDAHHALVHMMKALGKVASAMNDAEHEERALRSGEVDKYLADLVICAARLGGDVVDLDEACALRIAEKFSRKAGTDHEGRPMCKNCHSPEYTHPGRVCDTYVASLVATQPGGE